jgi:predicted lactoylglutathione lyase
MYSLEVQDPDGYTWEPMWMNADFDPQDLIILSR